MAVQLRSIGNYSRNFGDEIIHCTELLHNKCRPTKWRNFCISLRIPVKATCPAHLNLFPDSRRPSFKAHFVLGNFTRKPKRWSKSALSSDRRCQLYLLTASDYGFQNSGVYSNRTVQVRPSGGQAQVSNFVCMLQGPSGRTALHTACQADTCGE